MDIFIYVILFLVIVALVMSGKLRALVSGFMNIFVEDVAKTPEGAEAVYAKAIDKAQGDYAKADDTFRNVAGQLSSAKNSKQNALSEISSYEEKIKMLLSKGNEQDALILAEKREDLVNDVMLYTKQIEQLEIVYKDAQAIHINMQANLEKLKKDKKAVVNQLKMNKQMEQVYDDMDELKTTTGTAKLLSAIKDKVDEGNNNVAGAKSVHNNKMTTKIANIEKSSKTASANSYIESLKNKK